MNGVVVSANVVVLGTYGVVLKTNGVVVSVNAVVSIIGPGLFRLGCHSKRVDWPCAVSSATAF